MEYDILESLEIHHRKKIKSLIVEYHILSPDQEPRHRQLEDKLRQIYSTVEIIPSPYSQSL